jgi:hypothetical protein
MKTYLRVLLFFVLPVIAPLLFPPEELLGMVPDVLLGTVIAGVALLIGFFIWRGYSLALTFSIFLQGFNVITRLMMFVSGAVDRSSAGAAVIHYPFIILSVLSIGVSLWLLLRLDRNDVHGQMTA